MHKSNSPCSDKKGDELWEAIAERCEYHREVRLNINTVKK